MLQSPLVDVLGSATAATIDVLHKDPLVPDGVIAMSQIACFIEAAVITIDRD